MFKTESDDESISNSIINIASQTLNVIGTTHNCSSRAVKNRNLTSCTTEHKPNLELIKLYSNNDRDSHSDFPSINCSTNIDKPNLKINTNNDKHSNKNIFLTEDSGNVDNEGDFEYQDDIDYLCDVVMEEKPFDLVQFISHHPKNPPIQRKISTKVGQQGNIVNVRDTVEFEASDKTALISNRSTHFNEAVSQITSQDHRLSLKLGKQQNESSNVFKTVEASNKAVSIKNRSNCFNKNQLINNKEISQSISQDRRLSSNLRQQQEVLLNVCDTVENKASDKTASVDNRGKLFDEGHLKPVELTSQFPSQHSKSSLNIGQQQSDLICNSNGLPTVEIDNDGQVASNESVCTSVVKNQVKNSEAMSHFLKHNLSWVRSFSSTDSLLDLQSTIFGVPTSHINQPDTGLAKRNNHPMYKRKTRRNKLNRAGKLSLTASFNSDSSTNLVAKQNGNNISSVSIRDKSNSTRKTSKHSLFQFERNILKASSKSTCVGKKSFNEFRRNITSTVLQKLRPRNKPQKIVSDCNGSSLPVNKRSIFAGTNTKKSGLRNNLKKHATSSNKSQVSSPRSKSFLMTNLCKKTGKPHICTVLCHKLSPKIAEGLGLKELTVLLHRLPSDVVGMRSYRKYWRMQNLKTLRRTGYRTGLKRPLKTFPSSKSGPKQLSSSKDGPKQVPSSKGGPKQVTNYKDSPKWVNADVSKKVRYPLRSNTNNLASKKAFKTGICDKSSNDQTIEPEMVNTKKGTAILTNKSSTFETPVSKVPDSCKKPTIDISRKKVRTIRKKSELGRSMQRRMQNIIADFKIGNSLPSDGGHYCKIHNEGITSNSRTLEDNSSSDRVASSVRPTSPEKNCVTRRDISTGVENNIVGKPTLSHVIKQEEPLEFNTFSFNSTPNEPKSTEHPDFIGFIMLDTSVKIQKFPDRVQDMSSFNSFYQKNMDVPKQSEKEISAIRTQTNVSKPLPKSRNKRTTSETTSKHRNKNSLKSIIKPKLRKLPAAKQSKNCAKTTVPEVSSKKGKNYQRSKDFICDNVFDESKDSEETYTASSQDEFYSSDDNLEDCSNNNLAYKSRLAQTAKNSNCVTPKLHNRTTVRHWLHFKNPKASSSGSVKFPDRTKTNTKRSVTKRKSRQAKKARSGSTGKDRCMLRRSPSRHDIQTTKDTPIPLNLILKLQKFPDSIYESYIKSKPIMLSTLPPYDDNMTTIGFKLASRQCIIIEHNYCLTSPIKIPYLIQYEHSYSSWSSCDKINSD
ncbi:hypothetical protein JTE90_016134 [Oedothorax gibbosus]|uniref:Uncharacterized protein n=1 Tax=Oedothorax gibbosus TaxID=931172 RepID=A0AAV6U602_9ARAC|nr:hypothetical protein JTE90_016134 [Oedothorax gibbosus]